MNNKTVPYSGETAIAHKQYNEARSNLMLMLIFTVVNIVLLISDVGTMFLFSAAIPYWFSVYGFILGLSEYYVYAGAILFVYLLCWFFSKKHVGWLIAALIMFIIDIIYLGYVTIDMVGASNIIDIIIHLFIVYELIKGIYYGYKLKKLSSIPVETTESAEPTSASSKENSVPLRHAEDVKHRVFVEADYNNHYICYRHVKGTNEFVIDGYVYGEYKKFIEFAHSLNAHIDGLDITVGYDGRYHSYIKVNGVETARKIRII